MNSEAVKGYRVIITVKNNILLKRREALGFTQVQMAEAIGINTESYQSMEGLKKKEE
jgi:DNA-binding XRE family transcriptional regulator